MNDWRERVVEEKVELEKKTERLKAFLLGKNDEEQVYKLLRLQLCCMYEYLGILTERIELFNEVAEKVEEVVEDE